MMAWTIWQMFQRGFLLRLEVGCRKMTQLLWCEMIRTYIRYFGCSLHATLSFAPGKCYNFYIAQQQGWECEHEEYLGRGGSAGDGRGAG